MCTFKLQLPINHYYSQDLNKPTDFWNSLKDRLFLIGGELGVNYYSPVFLLLVTSDLTGLTVTGIDLSTKEIDGSQY